MLKRLKLPAIPCFGDDSVEIEELRKSTIFFGPNGSGKTSISRSLSQLIDEESASQEWTGGVAGEIRVYNRDYAENILDNSRKIPGVFILGEENVEIQKKIDEYDSPGGLLSQARDQISKRTQTLQTQKEAQEGLEKAFWDEVWVHTLNQPDWATPGFANLGGSKKRLAEKILEISNRPADELIDDQELESKSRIVFDDDVKEIEQLQKLPPVNPQEMQGYPLLAEEIRGREDASFSDLVRILRNQSWVDQGKQYLALADGKCPFCQEDHPESLAEDLEELFDSSFNEKRTLILGFQKELSVALGQVLALAELVISHEVEQVDRVKVAGVLSALKEAASQANAVIASKVANLALGVSLPALGSHISAFNALIDDANRGIREHNETVLGRKEQRSTLTDELLLRFTHRVVNDSISNFASANSAKQKAIEGISGSLERDRLSLKRIEDEYKSLKSQTTSSDQAIEEINRVLVRTGFNSFRIAASGRNDHTYRIEREEGEAEPKSLSEGERTFITFLYYYYSVANVEREDHSRPMIAVIDDPISSMDSDAMLIIAMLVRDLVRRATESGGGPSQVILLTHNIHFHKEVSWQMNQKEDPNRIYYNIRKNPNSPNELSKHLRNPIRSSYAKLWSEIVHAKNSQSDSAGLGNVALENTMRRILETYFKIYGGINQDGILETFKGGNIIIARSLYAWINGGSHGLWDDDFHSPTEFSTDSYLTTFREIFEATGHLPHYEMMMSQATPSAS